MYSDDLIGKWVAKADRKAHKVESVINGELVTNCGRRLSAEGWTADHIGSSYLCAQCAPD